MVKLIAQTPAKGALPVAIGALTLTEVLPHAIHGVMPFDPGAAAIPDPGQSVRNGETLTLWAGLGFALVLNGAPDPVGAAVTDQSDAWAVFDLTGPGGAEAMARLCPVDLRATAFPPGATARSLLGHMNACITRLSDDTLRVLVFRSMAQTAIHDLTRAMDHAQR